MRFFKHTILLFFTTLFVQVISAQDPADADEHFKNTNYPFALDLYSKLVKTQPDVFLFQYRAGYSIMHIEMDRKKAIPYLEKAVDLEPDNSDAHYWLGRAYHHALKLDKAEEEFNKYKSISKRNFDDEINLSISWVNNAKELIKNPIEVEFENLGPTINTDYPEYNPFIDSAESMIVFTSRRKENKGSAIEFDGYYSSDIWISSVQSGQFAVPENAGSMVNTTLDEQCVGLTSDGQQMFVYIDHISEYGDIYYCDWKKGKFYKRIKFEESVNSKDFESSATLSPDGNTLFFARKDKKGSKDIYMTRKLPNGKWGLSQKLPETINTEYEEDFPVLSVDGQTLYFSSQGHNSIGGYDLFKSTWNPEYNEWSQAENLGYPLNSTGDNMSISFTANEDYAYVARWREDSYGYQDIYRVRYVEKDTRKAVVKSTLKNTSGTGAGIGFISVIDLNTQEEVGSYQSDYKGDFIMILSPGKYQVLIDVDGYKPYAEELTILGKSDFQDFIMKDFNLSPN
jgi:hypothetical protein